eukprot:11385526-Prorocentrum_lima.AAC.1
MVGPVPRERLSYDLGRLQCLAWSCLEVLALPPFPVLLGATGVAQRLGVVSCGVPFRLAVSYSSCPLL